MSVVGQGVRIRIPVHAWVAMAFWLSAVPLSPAAQPVQTPADAPATTRLVMAVTPATAAPVVQSNAPAAESESVVLIKPGRPTPTISTASLTLQAWKALEKGEYEWAHLAMALWPDRVKAACRKDRSIAIAHDQEGLYEGEKSEVQKPKAVRGRKSR